MHDRTATAERSSGMTELQSKRRYPIGAELIGDGRAHFRVWAPKAKRLEVAIEGSRPAEAAPRFEELTREPDGYFAGSTLAEAGTLYRFRLNGEGDLYPDPASRFQPEGPHGPSCVVDPRAFQWTDGRWKGTGLAGHIMYEMHIGTFTPEGTWRAAAEKLPLLKEDGITLLEMMPIADFPGKFGWGYDGVNLFAPCRLYGSPDDLRFFIDRAHAIGLAVILDVVYNHFGPDGNYLGVFSDDYIHRERANEWGDSINFDGHNSGPVREFFIMNGRYWIDEFHFDGFRFDATQSIHDSSEEYIVGAIGRAARETAGERSILLVAENETQEAKLIKPRSAGGDDLDALWNDDWHHSALVALTGNREAYFSDYHGDPQEFISAAKYGYLFQGQPYVWQEAPRGYSARGTPPPAFVSFIENHDQVANTAFGERVRFLTSPGRYRAMVALLLLGPWTPLLFQGQEFGAASAFRYFSDVGDEELKEAIRKGRFEFLAQFPSVAAPEMQARLPVPHHASTFEGCKLDWTERERYPHLYALHRDLIRIRKTDPRFREIKPNGLDGAVLGRRAFVLRYFADTAEDERLLLVNFGKQTVFSPAPEPLLAAPDKYEWETMWTSEAPVYGGIGMLPVAKEIGWTLFAEAAVALRPVRMTRPRKKPKAR
ncbi:MAG TPA: malto-oligosyltrehalose trehalohydrolase [Chthoniobacterales bacterium]|nr:malto-oligosyltrehalose trehalohydrolase [Chthoniobacterales bacterium]